MTHLKTNPDHSNEIRKKQYQFYVSIEKTPAKHWDIFSNTLIAKKRMAKESFERTTYWLENKKNQAPARVRTQDLQPD